MRKTVKRGKLMSEINITPFTDVVLVLLIIFMITTPLFLQSGIKINLPKVADAATTSEKNINIKISTNGRVFLNEKRISLENLEMELTARVSSNPKLVVVINADKSIKYDEVVKVLDISKRSGVKKLALGVEIQRE